MVKISVIVPVYNVEEYLEECLDSIINQTLEDIEIICVNDGSTDNSLKILEKYSQKDERIKIISQENQGLGATRNVGMEHAIGEYISFIDSDDYISKDAFKSLYDNAITNNSDIVLFSITHFFEDGTSYVTKNKIEYTLKNQDFSQYIFNDIDVKNHILEYPWNSVSKLYKNEFLKKENIKFPINIAYEDVLFHVKVILKAKSISLVPKHYYKYRRSNISSIMHDTSKTMDIFKVVNSVENFLKDENYFEKIKNEFVKFKYGQLNQYITISKSETYFNIAKKEIKGLNRYINEEELKEVLGKSLNEIKIILDCDSFKEYECKLSINELNKENKKLSKENKKLKKKYNSLKKENKKILSSKSWKITKPLRKFGRIIK